MLSPFARMFPIPFLPLLESFSCIPITASLNLFAMKGPHLTKLIMLLKINEDLNGDGDPVLDFPVWAQRRVCSQTGTIRAILDVKQKTTWRILFLTKKLY